MLPNTELQKGNFSLWSCPREEVAQWRGRGHIQPTLESSMDQGMSSGVHTTSNLSGCPRLPKSQLWLFHTTSQRCQEAFWLQNLQFPGTPVLPHHPRCLWTLKSLFLPSTSQWDIFAYMPSKGSFKWIHLSAAVHSPACRHHRACLKCLSWRFEMSQTFAEGVKDKVMQHPLPLGGVELCPVRVISHL